ncbi:Zinc/iron permease [Collybia nuda]|uniref:Zinc/iron permease n=1 Tax=Collybia nuda TaxID=64659 RepID=A0A9P6CNU3_9AGAR|nr:Zinc/iron permease [Collybia nuda]
MSLLLAVSSFACGVLPLSFAFSKGYLERLAALGTGLLLGTALGVIIPEGIGAVAKSHSGSIPTSQIALSLLFGFTFMLIIEQLISPHSHSHSHYGDLPLQQVKGDLQVPSEVEFDAELGSLERDEGLGRAGYLQADPVVSPKESNSAAASQAFPLTLGLVIHGLTDGLALGVSSLTKDESGGASKLSLIVFLALIVHKAPTALALTTSLLATSLPRAQCKKHLAIFSASSPTGALGSYLLFSFLGTHDEGWTGIALLISGGTFLYVATVLQSVSGHSNSSGSGEMRAATRVLFISIGMFVPFLLSTFFGHDH